MITRINILLQSKSSDPSRPDSSSSASSATDWDTGHATVLRRHMVPPIPPPRTQPLVDLPGGGKGDDLNGSNYVSSSDSELEKIEGKMIKNAVIGTTPRGAYSKGRFYNIDKYVSVN